MESTEIIVLPDLIHVTVNRDNVDTVISQILSRDIETGSFESEPQKITIGTDAMVGCRLKGIVLICAHKKRDKRCSATAELLMKEFSKEFVQRGIESQIAVYGTSHVGGHKFAGNVILFPSGDWYGRVRTCHVSFLVQEALLAGSIVKDLWRGRMGHLGTDPKEW
ncbi:MAG: hypothetical protein SGCHY_000424 [Lobulomycetales sp.]